MITARAEPGQHRRLGEGRRDDARIARGGLHAICFVSPANGVAIQQLTRGGGAGVAGASGVGRAIGCGPVRGGNNFTAYRSADGVNWTIARHDDDFDARKLFLGLVCSVNDGTFEPGAVRQREHRRAAATGHAGPPTAAGATR